MGGIGGGTAGGFIGGLIGGPPGAFIGAIIGANIGAGIGQTIEHGGNLGVNIGNNFLQTIQSAPFVAAGFAIGGPPGAIAGAVLYNAGYTLASGGSFEDAAIAGIVTASYSTAGYAYYKTVGGAIVNKGLEIHESQQQIKVQAQLKVDKGSQVASQSRTAETDFTIAYDENGNFKGVIIKDRYYSDNPSEGVKIRLADGRIVDVPRNWKGILAENERGVVYSKSGTLMDPNSIRVSGPKFGKYEYPNGYVRFTEGNQPLDIYGKPNLPENTHHHLLETGLE